MFVGNSSRERGGGGGEESRERERKRKKERKKERSIVCMYGKYGKDAGLLTERLFPPDKNEKSPTNGFVLNLK